MRYIIGLGNYSAGDDAVGLKIVEYIDENMPERDFEVIDMSDNGLNIVAYLKEDVEKILFVDCVKMGKNPGEYLFFSREDVTSEKELANISTHEGDMLKILDMTEELGYRFPPIMFMGIEGAVMGCDINGLSFVISGKLSEYVDIAIKRLNSPW